MLALCTVIPQEHPGIRTCTIEVDGVAPARIETIAETLKRELLVESDGTAVAYRGPQRWVQGYDPAATADGWDTTVRRNGVYVITGGFGQVGLAIAERLATADGRPARARRPISAARSSAVGCLDRGARCGRSHGNADSSGTAVGTSGK